MSDWRRAPGKLLILGLTLGGLLASMGQAASLSTQLTTTEKNQLQKEARLVVDLVQNLHFSGSTFHEVKNEEILNRYLEELDPEGDIFAPEDLEFIHQRFDRSLKSVYLFRGDLEPAFEIFDIYASLARERLEWAGQRLKGDFDFSTQETITDFRRGAPVVTPAVPADQHWELRLKDEMLREILSGQTPEAARARLQREYAESIRRVATYDSFTVRERFLDAAIRSFDPHSGYSSAESTREFSQEMQGTDTGIGLVVKKEHGRCIVTDVYPGSPADLHSSIVPGDRIVALAQGEAPWVESSRQRQREIVAALRGAVGAKLRVAYCSPGSDVRNEVVLERAQVVLGADRAFGAISRVPLAGTQVRTIGWIVLPTFYAGGEGADAVSAARDVRELLDQMLAAKIDGLVLDLRGNPGGALKEAVAMSQLFLPGGIVMFTRGMDGILKKHALKDEAPVYPGPLLVLTSPLSASASEIFAGAMKFHHRALVVGAATTFGKGTVQNYLDLAKIQGLTGNLVKDWGTLRLTSERFYLPDGTAMQRRGVTSDVVLPDFSPAGQQRESDLPHALPPEDVTPPAESKSAVAASPALSPALQQSLQAVAATDIAMLPEWQWWDQEHQTRKDLGDRRTRSLNKETRSQAWEDWQGKLKAARQTQREFAATSAFVTQPLDIRVVKAALDAHEAKLRAGATTDGRPLLHSLRQGAFLVETNLGHLRDLPLRDFDYLSLLGDSETLATAFSEGSGQPVTATRLRGLLEEVALTDEKTEDAVLAVAAKLAPPPADASAARRGTEAVLARITDLEPSMLDERARADVPLRECLRLAARWADASATSRP